MKKLAFVGFGALGNQILSLIRSIKIPEEIIIFDDVYLNKSINGDDLVTKRLPFSQYMDASFEKYDFFVCLGYKHLIVKERIINELLQKERSLPPVIHPTSFIHGETTINSAVYIYPMCNIDKGVEIRQGSLLNNSVTLSHDTIIKSCCYISPGVITSGHVTINNRCFIGSGSIVSNGVTIGEDSIIGIGSVVSKDLAPNTSGIGNPLRILNNPLKLI